MSEELDNEAGNQPSLGVLVDNMYVDVHAHLIHPKFSGEEDAVADRAKAKGLEFMNYNGAEPKSNRAVLELCERYFAHCQRSEFILSMQWLKRFTTVAAGPTPSMLLSYST